MPDTPDRGRTADTLHVDRPPADVFAALTEPDRLAAWTHSFDHAERLDDGPLVVGSRLHITARVDGRPATLDLEVTELDAPRRLAVRGTSDDVVTLAELALTEVDGGTQVRATSRSVTDTDEDREVDPDANPAFADVGSALLAGLEAALTDEPTEPEPPTDA